MFDYIQKYAEDKFSSCKLIPMTMHATKFYTISLEGWDDITLASDDLILEELMIFASASLDKFIYIYGKTRAFTEPQFFYQPKNEFGNARFGIKIGTIELELYEEMMKGKTSN